MQQIYNLRDLQLAERPHARQGRFQFYSLAHGEDGAPGNFYLQLSRTYADFFSPRHRHNFDQVRFQLEGSADFDRDGIMAPGTVGYFPEGAYYGPQAIADTSLTLVLQFGGASGSGYMSEETFQAGIAALKQSGTFEQGIYKSARPGGGTQSKDAYQAVWEHITGRPLRYPQSRYDRALLMHPQSFEWIEAPQPGVRRKHLGTFSERGTRLDMVSLAAGASLPVEANTLLFAVHGCGTAPGGDWERYSSLYSGREPSSIAAAEAAELLSIRLPEL